MAQYNLAEMYVHGDGVPQDYNAALTWYHKAAEKGYPSALRVLGYMYEKGEIITKDEDHALTLYKKAIDAGDSTAELYYADLEKRIRCRNSEVIKLFGTPLPCATRQSFRLALKESGLRAVREDDRYWYDIYDSSKVLDKSNKLRVGYTSAGNLAVVEYEFPTHMDITLVTWVRRLVESKYGAPHSYSGNPDIGEVEYLWLLKDGVVIKVWRGWPNTTSYLSYTLPEYKVSMDEEIEANRRNQEAEKFRAQGKAF